MPLWVKSRIWNLWTCSSVPDTKLMALRPVNRPSNSRPFSVTTEPAGALITMPLVPDTRTLPSVSSQLMVMDLVIVNAPKPPGSRQLISPPVEVFEIEPAKVLHGAVRLHGLASSPTPDTQVRVACALAGAAFNVIAKIPTRTATIGRTNFLMTKLPNSLVTDTEKHSNSRILLPVSVAAPC